MVIFHQPSIRYLDSKTLSRQLPSQRAITSPASFSKSLLKATKRFIKLITVYKVQPFQADQKGLPYPEIRKRVNLCQKHLNTRSPLHGLLLLVAFQEIAQLENQKTSSFIISHRKLIESIQSILSHLQAIATRLGDRIDDIKFVNGLQCSPSGPTSHSVLQL